MDRTHADRRAHGTHAYPERQSLNLLAFAALGTA
jgi:hypothetical protein